MNLAYIFLEIATTSSSISLSSASKDVSALSSKPQPFIDRIVDLWNENKLGYSGTSLSVDKYIEYIVQGIEKAGVEGISQEYLVFSQLNVTIKRAIEMAINKVERFDYQFTLLSVLKLLREHASSINPKSATSLQVLFHDFISVLEFQIELFESYYIKGKYITFTLIGLLSMTRLLKQSELLVITKEIFTEDELLKDYHEALNSPSYFTNLMGDFLLSSFREAQYFYNPKAPKTMEPLFRSFYGVSYETLAYEFEGITERADFRVALVKELSDVIKDESLELWRDAVTIMLSAIIYESSNENKLREELWKLIPIGERTAFYAGYAVKEGGHAMIVEVNRKKSEEFNIRLFNTNNHTDFSPGHPAYLDITSSSKDKPIALCLNMKVEEDGVLVPSNNYLDAVLEEHQIPFANQNTRFLPFIDFTVKGFDALQEVNFYHFYDRKFSNSEMLKKIYSDSLISLTSRITAPLYLFQKEQQSGVCAASMNWVYLRSKGFEGMSMEIKFRMRLVRRLLELLDHYEKLTSKTPEFVGKMIELRTKKETLATFYSDDSHIPRFPSESLKKIHDGYLTDIKSLMKKKGFEPLVEPFITMPFYFKALANGTIHELYEWIMHVTAFDKELGVKLWKVFESEKIDKLELLDYNIKALKDMFEKKLDKPILVIQFVNEVPKKVEEPKKELPKKAVSQIEEDTELRRYKHTVRQNELLNSIEKMCLKKKAKDSDYESSCFPLLVDAEYEFGIRDIDLSFIYLRLKTKFEKQKDNLDPCACELLQRKNSLPHNKNGDYIFYTKVIRDIASSCEVPQIQDKKDMKMEIEKCKVLLQELNFAKAQDFLFCEFLYKRLLMI